jgi:trans-aconitate methyltransferase
VVLDLLGHVDHAAPRYVVDLGCGPGNNTELIADRGQTPMSSASTAHRA